MAIQLSSIKSLNDLPEGIRGAFALSEEGALSLDETKIRTVADVEAVKRAKDQEVAAHNATSAELKRFRDLGLSVEQILDLQSKSGSATEQTERIKSLLASQKEAQAKLSAVQAELDGIKPQYQQLKKEAVERQTADVLAKSVKAMKGVDVERLTRALSKDIKLGLVTLDESGEGLKCSDGASFEAYAKSVADDYGFVLKSQPGASLPPAPGSKAPSSFGEPQDFSLDDGGYLDDDTLKQARL